jgi:hypothetical protein
MRFRFTKFILKYIPVVNVEYVGSACVGYVADPTQDLSGVDLSLMQNLTQLDFKGVFNCWQKGSFSVKPSDMVAAPGMKYCCDPTEESDNVETYQGKLYFVSDNLTTANTLYGRWELDWGVEFYNPIITKAFNSTVFFFNADTNVGQSSPWGRSISAPILGDPSLVTLTYSGTDSVLTFADNGQYYVTVYYPGSLCTGMTASSTLGGTATSVSSFIAYTGAQTGKVWNISCTVSDNGTLTCHDSAGTHAGFPVIQITRVGPGPNALTAAKASKKQLTRELAELKAQVASMIKMVTAPSFPSFPSIQLTGESQTSTSVVGEITDGNGPPKAIVIEESASTSYGPVVVDALSKKKQTKKKAKKFSVVEASDEEDA